MPTYDFDLTDSQLEPITHKGWHQLVNNRARYLNTNLVLTDCGWTV